MTLPGSARNEILEQEKYEKLYHTLSIWLEIEFTSDIFLKTSVCALYSRTIFKNKSNQYLYNQITQEFFLEEIS